MDPTTLIIELSRLPYWKENLGFWLQSGAAVIVIVGGIAIWWQVQQIKSEVLNNQWTALDRILKILPYEDMLKLGQTAFNISIGIDISRNIDEGSVPQTDEHNSEAARLATRMLEIMTVLDSLIVAQMAIEKKYLKPDLFFRAYGYSFLLAYQAVKSAELKGEIGEVQSWNPSLLLHYIHIHPSWPVFEQYAAWYEQEHGASIMA